MPETISLDQYGAVLTITLDRPDTLNAINEDLSREVVEALKSAGRDDSVRCVVLTGAGRGFCSGQDLSAVDVGGDREFSFAEALRERYNPMIRLIRTIERPVIAAVNGVAAGAGASLALACDLRVAAEEASFVEAFVKVGLVPDCGGTFILPRLVGLARACEMAFTGKKIDAATALEWGLVNEVVPGSELPARTTALAAELAALPTRAIGLMKRAFNRAVLPDLDERLDYEADLQQAAGSTADYREGVAAFLEKRKPEFKGE